MQSSPGGGGVSQDFDLAQMYTHARTMRLVDGPDEVHNRAIARIEMKIHRPITSLVGGLRLKD